MLTEAVKALRVTDYQRVTIDTEISNFHLNLAACERLYSQPIPIAYTRHTSRYVLWSKINGAPYGLCLMVLVSDICSSVNDCAFPPCFILRE